MFISPSLATACSKSVEMAKVASSSLTAACPWSRAIRYNSCAANSTGRTFSRKAMFKIKQAARKHLALSLTCWPRCCCCCRARPMSNPFSTVPTPFNASRRRFHFGEDKELAMEPKASVANANTSSCGAEKLILSQCTPFCAPAAKTISGLTGLIGPSASSTAAQAAAVATATGSPPCGLSWLGHEPQPVCARRGGARGGPEGSPASAT
mmetsp:Transcript_50081/g.162111  ORF Transcript_50081/g.162111 Transcript_50081/m.162111 type:complete len:209 (-) Transcript_50081:270-896(-)